MVFSLEINSVTKSYGPLKALDSVSFSVAVGSAQSLLGPNGAGKSTLIKLILGLLEADSGNIRIFGENSNSLKAKTYLGVALQDTSFPPALTCQDLVLFQRAHFIKATEAWVQFVLQKFGFEKLKNKIAQQMSGGQKRILALTLALIGNPQLLILDEPTNALDVNTRRNVWDVLREYKKNGGTVLFSSHTMDEVEALADDVILIQQGKLLFRGPVHEIKAKVGFRKISFEDMAGKHSYVCHDSDQEIKKVASQKDSKNILIEPVSLDDAFVKLTQEQEP